MAIPINQLADAVAEALAEFSEDVMEDVKDSVRDAANVCKAELKANSPELTGDYKKGWRVRTAYDGPADIRLQVHNATDYQLTHLLEDGHANVNGGRTPAHPHIAAAAEKAANYLEKDVKMKVGKK